jgi:type I restriction enzyme R subunit
MPNIITEQQIEESAIARLINKFGYRAVNCFTGDVDSLHDRSNRQSKQEVVLLDILESAAIKLNPDIPKIAIDEAIEKLTARRSAMSPLKANAEIYLLLRDGVSVDFEDKNGKSQHEKVRFIDFSNPENNDFLAVTQLWIKGERYPRRPDIIIYVNGLPLVFIELKNSNVQVRNAYDDNLTNYKSDIPLLFNYNAFCVLSNAVDTKIGSFSAGYEHYFNWLRVDDETEKVSRQSVEDSGTSLERLIDGLLEKRRLLDYVENFVLYYNDNVKIVAQNHQFIGVNKAVTSFTERTARKGKLGVFWHTQGSGKSFSMIFLSRKILRKFSGNYTFLIITDRDDLDGQIYRNFLNSGTVKKEEAAQPKNSAEMRDFLGRNMRFVFTLIHKFRFDKGKQYPVLSDRNDIIVIVDEAHRTQYASLAENMRKGLPNAQYFAFTGTPILGRGDQLYQGKTFDWFGDYVSQYNFSQSIDDGATVPLYYQKRVPEVLIQNDRLSEDFYEILEEENLDEKSQARLEKEFSTEIEIIKRDDRLDTIAKDIVAHFPNRGYLGKGMVISIDKFTCVRMYDKVQRFWREEIQRLVGEHSSVHRAGDTPLAQVIQAKINYMRSVQMAVIVSEEAGEDDKFTGQGLDMRTHRKKMGEIDDHGHDIEYRFKQPEDKLQLVFVCAMWLTGFDAPTVSTLYLDKPMKGHTLMQTIARANRVTSYKINEVSKKNGEIVDYYNVFRNMQRALADFALGDDSKDGGNARPPVEEKDQLFVLLDDAIAQAREFCLKLGMDLNLIRDAKETFQKIHHFEAFANTLLEKDENWKQFKVYENTISSLYEACKPEIVKATPRPEVAIIEYLRAVVEGIIGRTNIDHIRQRIGELLDQSVVSANGELFQESRKPDFKIKQNGKILDLSKVDFDQLKQVFKETEYKSIEITNLREFIASKLDEMLQDNITRIDFAEKLQEIVNQYNSGGMTTENYFDELVKFTKNLQQEDARHIREGLSKDELELFDVLKKDKMTNAEEIRVKNAAKHLLKRLTEEQPKVLVTDWFKDSQAKKRVELAIAEVLDADLPDSYDRAIFAEKQRRVFELVREYAETGRKWAA